MKIVMTWVDTDDETGECFLPMDEFESLGYVDGQCVKMVQQADGSILISKTDDPFDIQPGMSVLTPRRDMEEERP